MEEKNIKVENYISKLLKNKIDVIVITTGHSAYKNDEIVKLIMKKTSLTIYDTIGLLNQKQIKLLKTKHNLFVLGRGDN